MYCGPTAQSSITQYSIYPSSCSTATVHTQADELIDDSRHNSRKCFQRAGLRLSLNNGLTQVYTSVLVAAANTNIFATSSFRGGTTSSGWLIWIEARTRDTNVANSASYLLHVAKANAGSGLITIDAVGVTTRYCQPPIVYSSVGRIWEYRSTPVGSTPGNLHLAAVALRTVRIK
jgi:hypothetical protein